MYMDIEIGLDIDINIDQVVNIYEYEYGLISRIEYKLRKMYQ